MRIIVKKGQPFGTYHNIGNNYGGNLNMPDATKKRRQSKRGHYHVAFVKEYADLSEKDFELKEEYGKDLVSLHEAIPYDIINLLKKEETITVSSVDSVYYVREGLEVVGKLSIRAQRRFRDLGLVYVYMTKDSHEGGLVKSNVNPEHNSKQRNRKSWNKKRTSTL